MQTAFCRNTAARLALKQATPIGQGIALSARAERDGVRLVSAVLGSGWGDAGKQKKWTDTKALMDYGFAVFHPYEASGRGELRGNPHYRFPDSADGNDSCRGLYGVIF